MKKFIEKINIKICITLTVIAVGLFLIINFTSVGGIGLNRIAPNAEILDFQFGFSTARAHEILSYQGELGRNFYQNMIIHWDFIFPLSYGLCAASWIAFLESQSKMRSYFYILIFSPLIAMLSDWVENFAILALIRTYPNLQNASVQLASLAGMIKWIFSALSIIIIVILIIYHRLLQKKNTRKRI